MQTKHPLISMRLYMDHLKPAILTANLARITRWRGACDEVWFATDYGFPPLDVHHEHARLMAEAAAKFRAAGIRTSLQISYTLGHGEHDKILDFRGLTDPMVGYDGTVASYCSCPRSPKFHAYLDEFIRAYCAWKPDRLWIDDDLRMHHHMPVNYGCFCDRCLAEFSDVTGRKWTREELNNAINKDNDIATRAAWIQFCRDSLSGVARTVAHAAIAVAPECRLGLQHCDQAWGGYIGPDLNNVFSTLSDISGKPVGSRPGGGFYNDHQPRLMIYKALMTSLQCSRLSECVDQKIYECENLPGSVMGKSTHGTAVECTLAIAQGCNSLSFTHLMFPHESEWHDTMMMKLEAWRPFWERYVTANNNTDNTGIEIVFSRKNAQRQLNTGEAPFSWAITGFEAMTSPATVMGLPLCWNEHAPAVWLTAPAAHGVDEAELRLLLARGLLIDGEAVEILEQRGLAHILGLKFKPVSFGFSDLKLMDDALNNGFAGQTLISGSFTCGKPRSVEIIAGNARPLSRYAYSDGTLADVEAVAVEHEDGSRLVVFGWGVGNSAVTTSRRHQILAAANWVSHEQLPVWLETPCQVAVIPRCDSQGRVQTLLLLNVSLDPAPAMKLTQGNTESDQEWIWMQPTEPDQKITSSGKTIVLPPLASWGVGVLIRKAED